MSKKALPRWQGASTGARATFADLLADTPNQPCLLCQAPGAMVGVFRPNDPQRYGAPPGKERYLAYTLCTACFTHQDGWSTRVEAALLTDIERQRATWN